ncbi:MAG: ferritin-like domain-containing protein [Gemmataceae bacterium]
MNYLYRWLDHFHRNRQARPEPDWDAPINLAPEIVAPLVRSLEQFHLGDGGGPASLIAWNAESFRSSSDGVRRLVDLWFEEEKEHSRLLLNAVKRFGGRPITGHWSFSVFCWVRRWFGVGFELTVLLLTEIVSTVYYRLLRRHGRDPALRAMCRLIIRDEVGHVAFHRDRLARNRTSYGPFWEIRFRTLGWAAATMLWLNHAAALKTLGATRAEFCREIRRELTLFIARLRREARERGGLAPCPAAAFNPDAGICSP